MTTKPKHGLVHSWLATELSVPGVRKSDALRDLNGELGTAYSLSRLGEWANGVRSVPDPVRQYMLRASISHVLHTHGRLNTLYLTDKQLDAIADALA